LKCQVFFLVFFPPGCYFPINEDFKPLKRRKKILTNPYFFNILGLKKSLNFAADFS